MLRSKSVCVWRVCVYAWSVWHSQFALSLVVATSERCDVAAMATATATAAFTSSVDRGQCCKVTTDANVCVCKWNLRNLCSDLCACPTTTTTATAATSYVCCKTTTTTSAARRKLLAISSWSLDRLRRCRLQSKQKSPQSAALFAV